MNMQDKVAVVTGAASGIGKEIAKTYFNAGAKVAIADLNLSLAGPLAQRPRIGGRVDVVSLEVAVPDRLPGSLRPVDGIKHVRPTGTAAAAENGPGVSFRSRRRARAVIWSEPGARPKPRSIRPGYRLSRVPNCSAITNGAWLGSMTPPEPTRIVEVPPAK